MPELIFKYQKSELTQSDDSSIEGYLSCYGEDQDGDVIVEGAYDNWMKEAKELPMLWGHDRKEIIGKWQDFKLDEKGLRGKGTFYANEVQRASEAVSLVKKDVVDGLSIGFYIKDYALLRDWSLEIREVDIKECSVVLYPANNDARIDMIKSIREKANKEDSNVPDPIPAVPEEELNQIKKVNEEQSAKIAELTNQLAKSQEDYAEKIKTIEIMVQQSKEDVMKELKQKEEDSGRPVWVEKEDKQGNMIPTLVVKPRYTHDLEGKAVSTIDTTPGARQGALSTWHEPRNMNVYDPYVRQIDVTAPKFTHPRMDTTGFSAQGSTREHSAAARGGTIASVLLDTTHYEAREEFSEASFDDVPNLRQEISMTIQQDWHAYLSSLITTELKRSVNATGSTNPVKTDYDIADNKVITDTHGTVTQSELTSGVVLQRARQMLSAIDAKYRMGAVYIVGKEFEAALHDATSASTGGAYAFNPALGVQTLYGYPVVVTDDIENHGTTVAVGEEYGFFGNFMHGHMCSFYKELTIREYTETKPGAVVYLAEARVAVDTINGKALSGLVVGT